MPTSETSTYKYGDIVDVEAGNEDGCPSGLAVVIHTEDRPTSISLWVLSANQEDSPIDLPADGEYSIYNPPPKDEAPLCWVVGAQYVKEVPNGS